jgi:F0F1-type ATP synthase membrane subunit b/b'
LEKSVNVLALAGGAIQLVPDGTLVFHFVLIVAMVGLLNATLLKPINRILAQRDRRAKGSSSEVQGALDIASDQMREYQRRLREARTSGYLLLDEERRNAARERDLKVAGVKAEVTRWLDQEKQSIKRDEEGAKARLTQDAKERAWEIGSRILGRSVGSSR